MARIRSVTYQMEKNFCGKCGIILSKDLDIFDKCPKCQETIEAWFDRAYVERVVRTIQENTSSWLVVALNKVMQSVVSVKYHGKINRYGGLSVPPTVFFEICEDFYLKYKCILLKLFILFVFL